jgi:hypothetical protein
MTRKAGVTGRLRAAGMAITVAGRLRGAGDLETSQTWRGAGLRFGAGGADLGRRAALRVESPAARLGASTMSRERPESRSRRAASGEACRPLLRQVPCSGAGPGFDGLGTRSTADALARPSQAASFKIDASIRSLKPVRYATRRTFMRKGAQRGCGLHDGEYWLADDE